MATAADEIVHVHQTPGLAKLFMAGVVVVMLGCVVAMLPFLTGRTHGFSAVLMLPFVLLLVLCAAILYWGVKADPKFLIGAKVLLILSIIFSLTFTGMNAPVVLGIAISVLYLVYFFRSKRLRTWYRS